MMSWIVLGEEKSKIKIVSKSVVTGLLPKGSYLTVEQEDSKFILRVDISFNSTDTDVATSFEGVLPFFYFQEGATTKLLAESQIILHSMPALDQAFPVFRDQSVQDQLDYSGEGR